MRQNHQRKEKTDCENQTENQGKMPKKERKYL